MMAPNETRQIIVVHGKVWWTCMRCMVRYCGHAPVLNKREFEFEKGARFQIQITFKFEPKFT